MPKEMRSLDKLFAEDDDEWGCDYCRNDGRLVNGRCPHCDAEYPEED